MSVSVIILGVVLILFLFGALSVSDGPGQRTVFETLCESVFGLIILAAAPLSIFGGVIILFVK